MLDCIGRLASLFTYCSFSHVKRNCNRALQTLAKNSLLSSSKESWRSNFPPCPTDVARVDVRASGPLLIH
ncbi:hypothetical protein RHMOL_Rhmol07G0121800 [Rhododendron molle]|uniref:Uncharacterized protein n=1 Tax=Rhododendron molle TaxID=49168 RepID=A0ACC0MZK0_RHOML|nr:hypothetical protein RHMOL_Rhmol07G0121800 [Rhododendron molle]